MYYLVVTIWPAALAPGDTQFTIHIYYPIPHYWIFQNYGPKTKHWKLSYRLSTFFSTFVFDRIPNVLISFMKKLIVIPLRDHFVFEIPHFKCRTCKAIIPTRHKTSFQRTHQMMTHLDIRNLKERRKERHKRKLPAGPESSNLPPRGREGQPEAEGKPAAGEK